MPILLRAVCSSALSMALALPALAQTPNLRIGGSARIGLTHTEAFGNTETQVLARMRLNFDTSTQTSTGAVLGGRVRLAFDSDRATIGAQELSVNAATLYAQIGGLRVEVGTTSSAFDSAGLLRASGVGLDLRSFGGASNAIFISHEDNRFGLDLTERLGLHASYVYGDLTARLSYVRPDGSFPGQSPEISASVDTEIGDLALSAAYLMNGDFLSGNNLVFLGASYDLTSRTTVGAQFVDNGILNSRTFTLFGEARVTDAFTVSLYIAQDSSAFGQAEAGGLGFGYDTGGATIAGSIQRSFFDETYVDLGIRFAW